MEIKHFDATVENANEFRAQIRKPLAENSACCGGQPITRAQCHAATDYHGPGELSCCYIETMERWRWIL